MSAGRALPGLLGALLLSTPGSSACVRGPGVIQENVVPPWIMPDPYAVTELGYPCDVDADCPAGLGCTFPPPGSKRHGICSRACDPAGLNTCIAGYGGPGVPRCLAATRTCAIVCAPIGFMSFQCPNRLACVDSAALGEKVCLQPPRMNAIWANAPDDLWAVGEDEIIHGDGTTWTHVAGDGQEHLGIWGSSPTDVWAVGPQLISHWDGVRWTSAATDATLFDVWGSSSTDVWAVGSSGTILHWDGRAWAPAERLTTATLRAVWGRPASLAWGRAGSDVWVGGDGGLTLRFDGTAWAAIARAGTTVLDLWAGPEAGTFWAMEDLGGHQRWKGDRWSDAEFVGAVDLAVRGWSDDNAWFVGYNVLHLAPGQFVPGYCTIGFSQRGWVRGVAPISPTEAWIVADGPIVEWVLHECP